MVGNHLARLCCQIEHVLALHEAAAVGMPEDSVVAAHAPRAGERRSPREATERPSPTKERPVPDFDVGRARHRPADVDRLVLPHPARLPPLERQDSSRCPGCRENAAEKSRTLRRESLDSRSLRGLRPLAAYAASPLDRPVAERRDATYHQATDRSRLPSKHQTPAYEPTSRLPRECSSRSPACVVGLV